jgi:hypothetical protein
MVVENSLLKILRPYIIPYSNFFVDMAFRWIFILFLLYACCSYVYALTLPFRVVPSIQTPVKVLRSSFFLSDAMGGDISKEIDPLTAGMSSDEITNYVSNVGGGLCGLPEWMKTVVGLGLNLNLILFGVFIVSYGIKNYNV